MRLHLSAPRQKAWVHTWIITWATACFQHLAFVGAILFLLCSFHAEAQITILQPNATTRIISRGEFLIQWSGTLPSDTVRIEFSENLGRTWQLITATATNNQFLWSPVPVIASDSCILRISTTVFDATPFSVQNTFRISYGSNITERSARRRFAAFSPDSKKILSFSNNVRRENPNDSNQAYQMQVWNLETQQLTNILALHSTNNRLFPQVERWSWNDNVMAWLPYWWSEDSRRIVAPVQSDTTFAVYNLDLPNGQPEREFTIPRFGRLRALRQVRWSKLGTEIYANILHRAAENDSVFTTIIRYNPFTGATLGSVSIPLAESTAQEYITFGGFSNDAQKYIRIHLDTRTQQIRRVTVNETFTGNFVSSASPPMGYRWRQYTSATASIWSPDDSLFVLVKERNDENPLQNIASETCVIRVRDGQIIRQIPAAPTPEPILWSSNSKNLMLWNGLDELVRDIYSVERGLISRNLRFNNISSTQFPGAGPFGINPYNVSWSNDMQRIAGYIRPFDPQNPTLGVWDAEQGCLLQIVRLPLQNSFPRTGADLRWTGLVSWSRDDSRLLLQNFFTDSTLIIPVPRGGASCRQTTSDSTFSTSQRGEIVLQEVTSFPAIICQTRATYRIPIGSLSMFQQDVSVTLTNPDDEFRPVQDFRIVRALNSLSARGNGEVIVEFTPQSSGRKTASLNFRISGAGIVRTLLVAVKDTIFFDVPNPTLNFGNLPANVSTTLSITLRNTGTSAITWTTQGTISPSRLFFIESVQPTITQPNQLATLRVRFQGSATPRTIVDSLNMLQCSERSFPLRFQANILPETARVLATDSLDFGRIPCLNGFAARTITIQNVGGRQLQVFGLSSDNEAFRLGSTTFPFILAPLEQRTLSLGYQSSRAGVNQGTISIRTNDPEQSTALVRVRAEQEQLLYTVQDSILRYESVRENTSRVETTLLTNRTNSAFQWTNLPLQLSNDFVLESMQPSRLEPNQTATLRVRFNGRPVRTEFTETLQLVLPDMCQTPLTITAQVRVGEPRPRLLVPSAISFDTLGCLATTRATLRLQNIGGRQVRIDSLVLEGGQETLQNASRRATFQILPDSALTLPLFLAPQGATGSTVYIPIQFEARTLGFKEAFVRILSNDTSTTTSGVQRVALFATKDSLAYVLTSQALSFFVQQERASKIDSVIIANTGTKTLDWRTVPRQLGTAFTILRITPEQTLPGRTSIIIIQFNGGNAEGAFQENLRVFPTQCPSAISEIRLQALVGRQALLEAPTQVEKRFICEDRQQFSVPLTNTGAAALRITAAELVNPTGNIRILRTPTMIASGERDSITLELFSRTVGVYSTRIRIQSNSVLNASLEIPCVLRKDSLGVQFRPSIAKFGSIAERVSSTLTVSLLNTGSIAYPLRIPAQLGVFRTENAPSAGTLLPAQSQVQFTIRFPASSSGTYSAQLSLEDSCARAVSLPISAQVVGGQFLLPERIALGQGQETTVPLYLIGSNNLASGTMLGFQLRIDNASLVELRSPSPVNTRMERTTRVLNFAIPFAANATQNRDSLLVLSLTLRGLLGNDTATTIRIDSASIAGLAVRGSTSRFQALGLNNSSGRPRLYYTSPIVLQSIAPNPTADQLTLRLDALESAPIQLFLVDVLGKRTLLKELTLEVGQNSVKTTLQDFATGVYLLEIVNAGGREAARIHVVR